MALYAEELSLNGKNRQRSREGEECAALHVQPDCPLPLLKVPDCEELVMDNWSVKVSRYKLSQEPLGCSLTPR